jgi:hypothetical protein
LVGKAFVSRRDRHLPVATTPGGRQTLLRAKLFLGEGDMDLWDVAKVMWRRRWVAAPLLLLSFVAAIFALLTVPPDYTAKAQIGVLRRNRRREGRARRDRSGQSVHSRHSRGVRRRSLNRPEIKRQLFAAGFCVDYEMTMKGFGLTTIDIKATCKSNQRWPRPCTVSSRWSRRSSPSTRST